MSIGVDLSLRNENFDFGVSDARLQQLIQIDRTLLREHARHNKSLAELLSSDRFLIEYAKQNGTTSKFPPTVWLQEQKKLGGEFTYTDGLQKNPECFEFNLREIVFDQTRHGFDEVDCPFDACHGVIGEQDTGDCYSMVPLRNVFVLGNVNLPAVRFDPLLFAQSWVLTFLRPKFVFRGFIACPKGGYGLISLSAEVHDERSKSLKNKITFPFKQHVDDEKGKFLPFEVATPEYSFQPSLIYLNLMVFHVGSKRKNEGFRIANCTVQCVLPEQPTPLTAADTIWPPKSDNDQQPRIYLESGAQREPEYVVQIKEKFYAPFEQLKVLQREETARKQDEIEEMLCRDLMGEQELFELSDSRKRSPDRDDSSDEGPESKRRR